MTYWLIKLVSAASAQGAAGSPPPLPSDPTPGSGAGLLRIGALIDKVVSIIEAIQATLMGVVGIIMVIMLVFGGLQYITGQPDAGKKTITAAIIGGVIAALAFAIINTVISLIQ
ncbi:MAG: hypothetical protein VE98_C0001G0566 [candidate division Kazan bacterium GW2011_GWA1_50_15]|uniref:Uncharacterized protein n=2 Tax=Bacteria division Kazan-3B-28 TaxID=1798534 RepID=A0A0G1ZH36_UNCK3|nr:MAG: hypothetical protein VE98_C0001G0566 [candidate division Kazan bacterium GW2011_GWA1_50_15]KKW25748.1 MAG: hypothetical protein VE99_C0001G0387 [candidate division Kazan bacterium GW2011_GWC1_52_13]KKW27237.1 MAG: hypothetical protein VF00_C0001G0172 [candidate division Kazan bacterium GW2011_GWB1_52_7]HAV65963.1 hypothetical protein [Patescibacteria group bacterium]HCR42531.1 hypothetical protein [Patescibacteria group bacterium]